LNDQLALRSDDGAPERYEKRVLQHKHPAARPAVYIVNYIQLTNYQLSDAVPGCYHALEPFSNVAQHGFIRNGSWKVCLPKLARPKSGRLLTQL
jgi:hypothetical protein